MIWIADRQKRMRVPRAKVEKLAGTILRGEKVAGRNLSFAFVGNAEMRRINRRFLRHDYATDVISFPFAGEEGADGIHGEIVVSVEYAIAEARKRGIDPGEELLRYVAHGVLHLLGYDDATVAKRRRMWKRQESYLRRFAGQSCSSK